MDSQATAAAMQSQMGYVANSYQTSQMIAPQHPQLEYHHQLQTFWANQIQEMQQTVDFKTHSLPLARIKKIMKADEDVKMISAEAPVVFAKACEMFILELTLRSWFHTEENKRRTLQKNDIAAAISRTDIFDFLVDIVPRDELKEEGVVVPRAALPVVNPPAPAPAAADSVPYYYVAPQPPMAYIPQQMWPKASSSNS